MIGAVIRSGKNTLVIDLPTDMMDLQTKLSSVGIDRTAENINLSDEDGDRMHSASAIRRPFTSGSGDRQCRRWTIW